MRELTRHQQALLEFKQSSSIKAREIENEENRYRMLLSLHGQVVAQGIDDIERQKQKINAQYAKFLDDFKHNAQMNAEKNISEIERNIMVQNVRLEEEAAIQDEELAYLDNKTTQLELTNEQALSELKEKGVSMEQHAKK